MPYQTALFAAAVLMGAATIAVAQEPDRALVVVPPIDGSAGVIATNLDLADLCAALGRPAPAEFGELAARAVVRTPDGTAVPSQVDVDESGKGTVSLWAEPNPDARQLTLDLDGAGGAPAAPAEAVTLARTDTEIVVTGPGYRVTHAAAQGWLPKRIEFLGTGKVFDSFVLNDRLHNPDRGGFLLRNDPSAQVRIAAAGPLRVAVEVTAHYADGAGNRAPGEPQARYTFSYLADSSQVLVDAKVTQDADLTWSELHFIELNFPDESFTHCTTGPGQPVQELTGSQKTMAGGPWGALVDGPNVLALLGTPGMVYDGRGGYGTYLHGPWTPLAAREWEGRVRLWIGSGDDALARVAQAETGVARRGFGRVSTQGFEDALAECRRTAQGDDAVAHRKQWAADIVERLAPVFGIAATLDIARGLPERMAAPGDPPFTIKTPEGSVGLVDNGEIGLAFRQGPGEMRLISLRDLIRGRELAAPTGSALFRIHTTNAGGNAVVLTPESGWGRFDISEVGHSDDAADRRIDSLTWGLSQHGVAPDISAAFTARLSGPRVEFSLAVTNDSTDRWIERVDFPVIALGAMGSPEDDVAVYPMASGNSVKAPLVVGKSFGGRYPGGWSTMQFMAQYDDEGGAYIAWHDPLAQTKEIRLEADPSSGATTYWFECYAEDATRPGNDFTSSGVGVVQLFDGDWYDAARIYREWAAAQAEWWPDGDKRRANPSAVADDIAAWAQTGGTRDEVVGRVKRFAEYLGVPCAVHWYSWHQIPFDVDYPHYFPPKEGFAEGVAELQAAGVKVMPYINGRLWDTGSADFDTVGRAGAAKQPNGDVYIEEYGSGAKLAPMCPTTDLWRSTVTDIVTRLCGPEYNVDGVYIDQVAAASPALCYDSTHGHPLGGGSHWTAGGYWPMLEALRRKLPEGKFLTTECNGEPFTQVFDEYLTWHWQYPGQLPIFPAVYGGQVHMFGRSYAGDALAIRMKAGQQLVFGEQVGWIDPGVIDDPDAGPFFRDVARMRHALRSYFVRGEMARPPKLVGTMPQVTSDWKWGGSMVVTTDAVLAGAWRSSDGRLAVILANVSDAPVDLTWQFDGRAEGFEGENLSLVARIVDEVGPAEVVPPSFGRAVHIEGRQVLAFELSGAP